MAFVQAQLSPWAQAFIQNFGGSYRQGVDEYYNKKGQEAQLALQTQEMQQRGQYQQAALTQNQQELEQRQKESEQLNQSRQFNNNLNAVQEGRRWMEDAGSAISTVAGGVKDILTGGQKPMTPYQEAQVKQGQARLDLDKRKFEASTQPSTKPSPAAASADDKKLKAANDLALQDLNRATAKGVALSDYFAADPAGPTQQVGVGTKQGFWKVSPESYAAKSDKDKPFTQVDPEIAKNRAAAEAARAAYEQAHAAYQQSLQPEQPTTRDTNQTQQLQGTKPATTQPTTQAQGAPQVQMYHDQQSGQDVPIFNSVDEAEATAKAMGLPVGTPILIRTQNGKAVVGYVR